MTTITRRQALAGLGTIGATGSSAASEVDADLLQLGRELERAERAFHEACETEALAYRRWEEIRPQPDAIIIAPRDYRLRMFEYSTVLDPRGNSVPFDELFPLRVAEPSSIRVALASRDGRTFTAKWLRRALFHAEQFERDMAIADEQCGVSAAGVALRDIWYKVERIAAAVFERPTASIADMALMARAAALSDLCRATCIGISADPRIAKLSDAMREIVGRSA